MRINVTKIEFDYREKYFDIKFSLPDEKYARWLCLSWKQWQFVKDLMDGEVSGLRVGDVAVTDGLLRTAEFYADAVRVNDCSNGSYTVNFPFEELRMAIDGKLTELPVNYVTYLKNSYWPKVRVIYHCDMNVVAKFRYDIEPYIRQFQRIASNYSDGCKNVGVVHIYSDGWSKRDMARWADRKNHKPSFYWEVKRYKKLCEMPASLRNANIHTYGPAIKVNGEEYILDPELAYKTGEYTSYGWIMNGGLIWHGGKNGYSVHT